MLSIPSLTWMRGRQSESGYGGAGAQDPGMPLGGPAARMTWRPGAENTFFNQCWLVILNNCEKGAYRTVWRGRRLCRRRGMLGHGYGPTEGGDPAILREGLNWAQSSAEQSTRTLRRSGGPPRTMNLGAAVRDGAVPRPRTVRHVRCNGTNEAAWRSARGPPTQ
jgi:hypothetical protein